VTRSLALLAVLGCGGGGSIDARSDARPDAPQVDARSICPCIADDWDVVFEDSLDDPVESTPLSLVVAGTRIVSFGAEYDHLLERGDGSLVTRRGPPAHKGEAGHAAQGAVVAIARSFDLLRTSLRSVSAEDLSLVAAIDAALPSSSTRGFAYTVNGDSTTVVWEGDDGTFRVEEYAVSGGPPLQSTILAEPSVATMGWPEAVRRGDTLVLTATPLGSSLRKVLRVEVNTGVVAEVTQPADLAGAFFTVLLTSGPRAWVNYVLDGAAYLREVDPESGVVVGEPILLNGPIAGPVRIWGDYLMWIGGDLVYVLSVLDPGAPLRSGRMWVEPPDDINTGVNRAFATDGTDAYVVFQSRINSGAGRLHLRKLTYPPTFTATP
jgi:hypothetical protein